MTSLLVKRNLATRQWRVRSAQILAEMDRDRELIRAFITRAAEVARTDLSGLARRAGIAPSTLTRFMNGEVKHLPTARTLLKISAVTQLPLFAGAELPERVLEWLQVIRRIPAPLEEHALQMLRGVGEAAGSTKKQPGPREGRGRTRRSG